MSLSTPSVGIWAQQLVLARGNAKRGRVMHNGAIMSSEVQYLVEHGLAYPLVRLSGVLDGATAGTVRSILLDLLARQPEALVVDVADLAPPAPDSLDVLRDLR